MPIIERWGIAGVWALIAFMLWKKQEKGDEVRLTLQRELLPLQVKNADELKELITHNIEAQHRVADALKDINTP